MNEPIITATLASLALQAAQGQVGQCEQPAGSNSGPMVNKYLAAAGLQPGYAWCQAFMYWCYNEAARQLHLKNPMVRTAGVQDCWNRSAQGARLLKQEAIKRPALINPGDQLILFYSGYTGHTGIVECVELMHADAKVTAGSNATGTTSVIIHTIEGNSNDGGSREGIAVVRHTRKLNDKALMGFIRYSM